MKFIKKLKIIFFLQMYINDHPEVIVIDPMESVRKLFDRTTSYQIMKECEILEEGWLYKNTQRILNYKCGNMINRGYYMAPRGYEFYLRVLQVSLTSEGSERVRDTFSTRY